MSRGVVRRRVRLTSVQEVIIRNDWAEYRVVRLIGEGGMGEVYEAEDTNLQRQVALKLLKSDVVDRSKAYYRFLREARAVAGIQHDHIVPVYQVGEDAGHTFLIMPLLSGSTLDVWRARQSTITLEQIARFGQEISSGLQAAPQTWRSASGYQAGQYLGRVAPAANSYHGFRFGSTDCRRRSLNG